MALSDLNMWSRFRMFSLFAFVIIGVYCKQTAPRLTRILEHSNDMGRSPSPIIRGMIRVMIIIMED